MIFKGFKLFLCCTIFFVIYTKVSDEVVLLCLMTMIVFEAISLLLVVSSTDQIYKFVWFRYLILLTFWWFGTLDAFCFICFNIFDVFVYFAKLIILFEA